MNGCIREVHKRSGRVHMRSEQVHTRSVGVPRRSRYNGCIGGVDIGCAVIVQPDESRNSETCSQVLVVQLVMLY